MLADAGDVQSAINDASTELVDMRPAHQFIGINRHPKSKRNGTIPTSKNLPESWITVNGGGMLRSKAELAKLYALAGGRPNAEADQLLQHWALGDPRLVCQQRSDGQQGCQDV